MLAFSLFTRAVTTLLNWHLNMGNRHKIGMLVLKVHNRWAVWLEKMLKAAHFINDCAFTKEKTQVGAFSGLRGILRSPVYSSSGQAANSRNLKVVVENKLCELWSHSAHSIQYST